MIAMGDHPSIPSVEGFWRFVDLRMEAYALKAQGLKSTDPVLSSAWFPNVKRELDRGTVYFQEQRKQHPDDEVIYLAIMYRLLNRRQTFESYGRIPCRVDISDWRKYLSGCRSSSAQIFTGRHQTIGLSRYFQTLDFLESQWWPLLLEQQREIHDGSREKAWKRLKDLVPGVSNFSAWQIICDVQESFALNENLWAYMGPGPQGAYQMIHEGRGTQRQVLEFARSLVIDPRNTHVLTLKNVEHAMCEYFRYTRSWWAR